MIDKLARKQYQVEPRQFEGRLLHQLPTVRSPFGEAYAELYLTEPAEDSRVAIRNIRRHSKDALDKLAKNGEAGEDEVHRAGRELDELTHTYVAQVDELLKHKEAELLEV